MRKILIIVPVAIGMILVTVMSSCNNPRRKTGSTYMPDMAYSRAYETYSALDTSRFTSVRTTWGKDAQSKIFFNSQPVKGTMARGDMPAYALPATDSGYARSATIKNPLEVAAIDMKEAERLYLVNCAICHGAKLDGNGPLWKDGGGPFPAAPRNFMDPVMKAMPEGTMFHSVTYGRNQMGSYASQLSTKQRWMVIAYVKNKQGVGGNLADSAAAPKPVDSTAAAAVTK